MAYIGIDIGGTKCAVVKGDAHGVTGKVRFDTADLSGTLESIFEAVERFLPAEAIGVCCGGPLDENRGVILSPPNLPGWDEVHITDMLTARFGIPAYLCNDANACALAEWKYGAGQGSRNMIFLTFGTGLGAGLILDGRLYSGTSGMAGEVGHIRMAEDGPVGFGKAGSLEGFCSGGGIARLAAITARRRINDDNPIPWADNDTKIANITTKSLAELANNGDPDALEIFDLSAEKLGLALSLLVDILNPERIVIGSVYARQEHLFRDKMLAVMERECIGVSLCDCSVLPAALGEEIGDYAALAVATEGGKNESRREFNRPLSRAGISCGSNRRGSRCNNLHPLLRWEGSACG